MGSVITSSPTRPTCGRPSSSHDSTLQPSDGACSSPSYTGRVGTPPTKAVHTSVPPLVEKGHTPGRASRSQRKPSTDRGAPVTPTARSALRSRPAPGSTPAFMQVRTNAGLVPKIVMPSSAASRQSRSGPGWVGLPS